MLACQTRSSARRRSVLASVGPRRPPGLQLHRVLRPRLRLLLALQRPAQLLLQTPGPREMRLQQRLELLLVSLPPPLGKHQRLRQGWQRRQGWQPPDLPQRQPDSPPLLLLGLPQPQLGLPQPQLD